MALVTVSHAQLEASDDGLSAEIEAAFGAEGLGLLLVSGVPGLAPLRERLLPLAHQFGTLAPEVRARYESPSTFYSIGWSHGKERLQGGVPDFAKGSYYNNPLHNRPFDDEAIVREWPSFAAPNVWPTEHVPEMEGAFMELGQLIVRVGRLVARQCDAHVHARCPAYPRTFLADLLGSSRVCKARLLHYYAKAEPRAEPPAGAGADGGAADAGAGASDADIASWCGWHNDHGSLTGLVAPLYLDERTGARAPAGADAGAGLFIRGRRGQLVRAAIPPDHLAFQIGETAQVHSGGVLQATPHAVRGPRAPGISREQFAVFMEPHPDCPMRAPDGAEPAAVQPEGAAARLPAGVPPLLTRWGTERCPFTTCDFGAFSDATYRMYYAGDEASANATA